MAREKNKPLEYAYAEDNSHSCLGRRRNMISWIEGISFKVSFKTRKKNIAHNSVSLFPFLVISSHRRCSATRGVFRNFGNVTENTSALCQSFFFNKVAGWGEVCKFYEFCEISKDTFFTEHLGTTPSIFATDITV